MPRAEAITARYRSRGTVKPCGLSSRTRLACVFLLSHPLQVATAARMRGESCTAMSAMSMETKSALKGVAYISTSASQLSRKSPSER